MSLYRIAPFKVITRAQFNNIESIAIHYDWNLAFSGRSHGNEHLFRTVQLIEHLWDLLDDKNALDILDCAVAGGLLHDIGLVEGNPDHCFNGKRIAGELLNKIGLEDDISTRILHCIESHDGEVPATTLEAKLVHDADTIDKLGPLGAVRHIWKLALLGDPDLDHDKLRTLVPDHLNWRYNKLYLDVSREIAKKQTEHQAGIFSDAGLFEQLFNFISGSARKGIPVDKMIPELLSTVPLEQNMIDAVREHMDLAMVRK